MNILAQERNYLSIDIETKYKCCLRRKKSKWSIKKTYLIIMLNAHYFSKGLNYSMTLKKVCLKNHIGQKQITQRNYVVK